MAQIKTFSWTNANPAVARNQSLGFSPTRVMTIDQTNGGSWLWVYGMTNGYYLDVDAGTITTSNGFTPLSENSKFGAAITAFTNADPGVITVADTALFGFAAGDTIKVSGVADDQTGTNSLNQNYTVASVTATTITTETDTSVTGYSVWVSGGFVSRVSDTNGDPVATENFAIEGVTIGTGAVGANSAVMIGIAEGQNPVD